MIEFAIAKVGGKKNHTINNASVSKKEFDTRLKAMYGNNAVSEHGLKLARGIQISWFKFADSYTVNELTI